MPANMQQQGTGFTVSILSGNTLHPEGVSVLLSETQDYLSTVGTILFAHLHWSLHVHSLPGQCVSSMRWTHVS